MNKTDLTTAFEQTSFLYGGNAQFIEQLYARYLENPSLVDQHWRQFFAGLEDNTAEAKRQVQGPSWQRADWPVPASGDLVSALDGNWPVVPPKAPATKADGKAKEQPSPLSLDEVRKATPIPSVR